MGRDKKITLSLFLTWVVFGLFNLFGQPEAFVPPIIVDGLIVAGLGIYFCFPFQKNFFHPAILCFTLFVFQLSVMELGWLNISMTSIVIAISINILFITYLILGAFSILKKDKLIAIILFVIILSHSISICFALFDFFAIGKFMPIIVYSITGIAAMISIFLLKNEFPSYNSLNRLYLLIILHFIFDIGNYLALLQFTSK
jgi:hypothetical protein